MRPSKLSIENFGPYRRKTFVDFASLGEFFLICGPTGSGKSTIFDAVTYGLFGQAPGGRQGFEAELVSDFAQPGEKPIVELEFFLSGSLYKVIRQAPYSKPKRGEGWVEVPAAASLFITSRSSESGWKTLSDGVRQVNKKVAELIGLSAEEFNKIILLPQGEFQKFLEMDSTKRSEVLEKLFPVDLYERITELAKLKTQAAKNGLSSLDAELGRLKDELGEEPETELSKLKENYGAVRLAEAEAATGLGATERRLELVTKIQAKQEKAERTARVVEELLHREEEEKCRRARIELAKAAAAVQPLSRAFSSVQSKTDDLANRARLLSEKLAELKLKTSVHEEGGKKAAALEAELVEDRRRLFSLEKALQLWRRRSDAEESMKKALGDEAESARILAEEQKRVDGREAEDRIPAPGRWRGSCVQGEGRGAPGRERTALGPRGRGWPATEAFGGKGWARR